MKFVVLRRAEAGLWEHVGAQEVEVEGHENVLPEQRAVEQVGRAGVFVAVPFDDWIMLEAEAQITVKPVARRIEADEAPDVREQAEREVEALLDDPELEGMTQGPRIS